MNALRKIDKILNRVRSVVLVALLVSMMGMCTMNVVLRYLIKGVSFLRPFSWVNEMMQMLAIWVVFLAAGLGVRQDAHVSLESFTEKYLPAKCIPDPAQGRTGDRHCYVGSADRDRHSANDQNAHKFPAEPAHLQCMVLCSDPGGMCVSSLRIYSDPGVRQKPVCFLAR